MTLDLFGNSPSSTPAITASSNVRDQLVASAWRQGRVLPPELALQVIPALGGYPVPADGVWPTNRWYVVVSQDCDLVHGSLTVEPVIEVVLVTSIAALDVSHEHLRAPRLLHVALTRDDDSAQPVEVAVNHRGFLRRDLLLNTAPLESLMAKEAAVKELAMLLGRRYLRTSRPETFDGRLRPATKKIVAVLKSGAQEGTLLDVLFRIHPMEELPPDQTYLIEVFAVLQDDFDDIEKRQTRPKIEELAKSIRATMRDCGGIEVDAVHVVGRREIDVRLLDQLRSMEIVWPLLTADAASASP